MIRVVSNLKFGKYQHYKGDIVQVMGIALHSETLEEFVMYKHISGKRKDEDHYWVRPKKMFMEDVVVDGKEVPRFTYVG
ncbi:MAG: hypothetical protein QT02_C0004G0037 [archaeon GW2011_AR9]|nr:MAG: hypothetical protein QT02_C0004G0037 [archaeon GW2011_AR9]MBS3120393.1 DUF1653 domain-containing protein [Candidatus Woesearchaeota archaeon]HIG93849.1 DUF1653 domain-containing protein [Candidatus Woesearchaeota archaeon]HIH12800.1 DUF1653 domain-containing protein [Candidatus Woesearchaeota archaeon]